MKPGSRIADLDFKSLSTQRRAPRRLQWLLLAFGAVTAASGAILTLTGASGNATATDTQSVVSDPEPKEPPALAPDRMQKPLQLPDQDRSAAAMRSAVLPELTAPFVQKTAPAPGAANMASLDETPAVNGKASLPDSAGNTSVAAESPVDDATRGRWQEFEVTPGDSLAVLFDRAGLSPRDVYNVVSADDNAERLTDIFPGDTIGLRLSDGGDLLEVRHDLSETRTLHVKRTGDGFTSEIETRPLERRVAHASAVIKNSLFAAGARAGLSDNLIMELATIFGWDVDFALDIRRGDAFTIVYQELYRDGEKVRNGNIIAAEFVNRGDRFRAVRYTDPDGNTGYYTPEGRNMRKAFLRTPVNFTRVSSGFNPRRLHPVLGKRRPHMGTDYAASPGTPIKAAGDGKIIHLGRKGGYGRAIIIQHGTRYTTLYGHMSGYKRGLHSGDRVRQGQVIGYVGSSGLATGPHLHYEFRIDGVHRNPRTVKLPEAEPIPDSLRADFRSQTRPRLAKLDTVSGVRLASSTDE